MSKCYTASEVAEMVQTSASTLHTWVHYRRILPAPTVEIGQHRFYDEAGAKDVVKLVAKLREKGELKPVGKSK